MARPVRVGQVPNGAVNSCNTCHTADLTVRNAFGQMIEQSFLVPAGPTGVVQWGPALAAADADGDGRSNGVELLDPNGTWVAGQPNPGSPNDVTLPGVAQASVQAPALDAGRLVLLAFLLGVAVTFFPARRRQDLRR